MFILGNRMIEDAKKYNRTIIGKTENMLLKVGYHKETR